MSGQSQPAAGPMIALPVRYRLVVAGVVQGVGFRPFVHRLAHRFGLKGWVLNSTEGVVVELEGEVEAANGFLAALRRDAPPRAVVARIDRVVLPPIGYTSFTIAESRETEGHFALISPDICICDDCLRELRDPADRRYGYPFINCTNCGPRFTIVAGIPYDRTKTSMGCFGMCPSCDLEYHDPTNRRFHAQPNACPACGPNVWLVERRQELEETARSGGEAIQRARSVLAGGGILAIKGLGGFHLACDAGDDGVVGELRRRKRRSGKPFAVMAADAGVVATFCHLSAQERQLLESPQRPIVLLRQKDGSPISPLVAPGNRFLGVMLPYTPLHYLLMNGGHEAAKGVIGKAAVGEVPPVALVMTSGNLSEEPIATGNREALVRLQPLADGFLLHNRDIVVGCDDSVTRLFRSKEAVIRRSRGYAPFPVPLGFELRDVLACGGELKNTLCITKGNYAFLSQHIGDLENAETLWSFTDCVEHFRRLFRLDISAVAHDMHPEYLSTRYAWELARAGDAELPLVPVQHHHAHVAACMAENGVDEPVIGVSFDGTGYGDDGRLWGGEFLACDFSGYRRAAHLKYLPLPGGEVAIKRPYRMAVSYLLDCFGAEILEADLPPLRSMDAMERAVLHRQIERGINSPLTSSAGRLFDAVSSVIGIRQVIDYEGQAAIELEMVAGEGVSEAYDWALLPGRPMTIDMAPAVRQIVDDVRSSVPVGTISARFHNTVARMIAGVCQVLREVTGNSLVALSGGVFQNLALLERACALLETDGFRVLIHHQVPTNDGGISLGQAVVANRVLDLKR